MHKKRIMYASIALTTIILLTFLRINLRADGTQEEMLDIEVDNMTVKEVIELQKATGLEIREIQHTFYIGGEPNIGSLSIEEGEDINNLEQKLEEAYLVMMGNMASIFNEEISENAEPQINNVIHILAIRDQSPSSALSSSSVNYKKILKNNSKVLSVKVRRGPSKKELEARKATEETETQNSAADLEGWTPVIGCSGDFFIDGKDTLGDIAKLENCTTIYGHLIIEGTKLTNLSFLDKIVSIRKSLQIVENVEMENLYGLDSLSSIGDNFIVYNNGSLTNLSGLESLVSINGGFLIYDNESLKNLEGVNNLSSVKFLTIDGNPSLTNLSGLENLVSIGLGGLGVTVNGNRALKDLKGLNNLSSINGDVDISMNNSLVNLSGLDNLAYINGYLVIDDNNSLKDLSGLGSLYSLGENLPYNEAFISICGNNSLESLSGLDNLTKVKSMNVCRNPKFDCSPYNKNPPLYFPLTYSRGNKVDCITKK